MAQISKHPKSVSSIDLSSPWSGSTPTSSKPFSRSSDKAVQITETCESQWVAFPPLPESTSTISSLSSAAIQYVSTSLKPFSKPPISYPSAQLTGSITVASGLKSAFGGSSQSKTLEQSSNETSIKSGHKRSRTATAPTIPLGMSRKRSKSDLDPETYRSWSSNQAAREGLRYPGTPSGRSRVYGSSVSLAHLSSPSKSSMHRPQTSADLTPANMLRRKHRAYGSQSGIDREFSIVSSENQSFTPGHRTAYSTNSSPLMRSRHGSFRTNGPRGHSHFKPLATQVEVGSTDLPIRPTYLGGVGVYLSKHEEGDDEAQDKYLEITEISRDPNSKLNVNTGLCVANPGEGALRGDEGWYNRLVVSPISSASSSVYSFFTSGSSDRGSSVTDPGSSGDESTQDKESVETGKIEETASETTVKTKNLPFRKWDF